MANNLKHNTTTKNAYVHYTVPEPPTPGHTTSPGPPKHPPPGGSYWDRFDPVTAAIAEGKRPAPFRTRKLSPPAPMVLHPPGCGRVGHRRTPTRKRGTPSRCAPLSHVRLAVGGSVPSFPLFGVRSSLVVDLRPVSRVRVAGGGAGPSFGSVALRTPARQPGGWAYAHGTATALPAPGR